MKKAWLKDTIERVAFTWIEAFLGLLLVDWSGLLEGGLDLALVEQAAVSATIAALAVVKAALASRKSGLSPASFASGTDSE